MNCILNITSSRRFQEWHLFRSSLSSLPEEEQLKKVCEYWGKCPVVQFYIDWDSPSTWETPWQLIHDGKICPSGIAICMYHTLLYANEEQWGSRIKLQLIKDKTQGIFLIVKVDDDVLLNYIVGKTFQGFPVDAELCQSYVFKNGKYIEV